MAAQLFGGERCGSGGSIWPLPAMNQKPATTANDKKDNEEEFFLFHCVSKIFLTTPQICPRRPL